MNRLKQFVTGSIRRKLAVIVALVVSVAILVGGIYTILTTTLVLQQYATTFQSTQLSGLAQRITSFLRGVQQDVYIISQSQAISAYLAAKNNQADADTVAVKQSEIARDLLTLLQVREIYDQAYFIDSSGHEIVRVYRDPNTGAFMIAEPNDLGNLAEQPYFSSTITLAPNQFFVSSLELDIHKNQPASTNQPESLRPMIRYAKPVFFQGRVAGLVMVNVPADNFLQPLSQVEGLIYLVDEDGYYLYHPDQTKRWGRELQTGITLSSDYSTETALKLQSLTPGTLIKRGQVFVYHPVEVPASTGQIWYLGSIQSLVTVFALLLQFIYGAILVTFFLIIMAVFVSLMLARTITNPLATLTQAALQAKDGNFNVQLSPTSHDEVALLSDAFNRMADQIRTLVTSLEKRVAERTRALEASAAISRHLTGILDLDELLQQVVTSLQMAFGYYHVHIYLLDPISGDLVMREGTGAVGRQLKSRGHRLKVGKGLVGNAAKRAEVVLVSDVLLDPRFIRNPLLPETQAEMAIPLLKGNTVLGVLDIQSNTPGLLTAEDIKLMQSIADQLMVALENIRLFQQAQTSLAEVETLNRRLTRLEWHDTNTRLQISGYMFTSGDTAPTSTEWLPEMTEAVTQQATAVSGNQLAVPLTLRGEMIGVLGFQRKTDRGWTTEETDLLKELAEQIALALDSARLVDETERAAWRDRVVSEITTQVWSSAELEMVMKTAVTQLGNKLNASEVVIRLDAGDTLT